MTAAAMTRPSPATVLSAGERARAVAEALLGLADDAGGVEVSQAALAVAAGTDRRTLGRAMGRLEDAGLVSVEEEATPNSPAVYDVGRLVEAAAAEGLRDLLEAACASAAERISSVYHLDDGPGSAPVDGATGPEGGAAEPGRPGLVVEVYTQPGCAQCETTKRALARKAIPYVELDAAEHLDMLRARAFTRTPCVLVREGADTIVDAWEGYRPERIGRVYLLMLVEPVRARPLPSEGGDVA